MPSHITYRRADPRLPEKIKGILLATRTHAFNLAKFVTIYKLLLLAQKRINGGKERDLDSLIAGGLGGWWCFGQRTPVSFVDLVSLVLVWERCVGHERRTGRVRSVLVERVEDVRWRGERWVRCRYCAAF